jgi:hypothetical protein
MDLKNFKILFTNISTGFASLIYTKKRIQKSKLRGIGINAKNQ